MPTCTIIIIDPPLYGCPTHNFICLLFRTYVGELGSGWSRLVAASRIEWSLRHNADEKLTKIFGRSKTISTALVSTFKTNPA